ncbi:carotenoid oxygenase family protein [Spirulina major]|uniref:carotenoid oxygenase family protein n=1 Tax=Spirulina major TaxID=270636 RepID=UPI0009338242|nr:carotenoid oxygenase family protein [Spirulina major]
MTSPATKPAWHQVLNTPGQEFPPTNLSILDGAIPPDLSGTLYRNGPGRLERGGETVGHWFDGDGAILAVQFAGGQAQATYRYVQTAGYQAEAERDRFLFPNYGRQAPGPLWNNWLRPVKNAANTSVIVWGDRLLALWEGGQPHALDLDTLATYGIDSLGLDNTPFSAHPKRDPHSGEIYNFGVTPGPKNTLHLYRHNAQGQLLKQGTFALDGLPVLHDFCLAGRYLVFFVSPVRVNLLTVIFGQGSYCDAMAWRPELGTQILIFDRDTLTLVTQKTADPWYQWHFSNGCEHPNGTVQIDYVHYDDFTTNQYLREVPSGVIRHPAPGSLRSLCLDPRTGAIIHQTTLCETWCEFPTVHPEQVGQPWARSHFSVKVGPNPEQELYRALGTCDRTTDTLTITELGPHHYPSEPVYIPNPTGPDSLITVVYDSHTHQSEVWLYHSDDITAGPICRLALPQPIPHSFHGIWRVQ